MAQFHEQPFGDGVHRFRLRIGELRELQEKCNAGPATILGRLMSVQPQASDLRRPIPDNYQRGIDDPDFLSDLNIFGLLRGIGGDWRVDDIRETIRLGLIGGGMSPTDAFILIATYVDPPIPLNDNVGVAAAILIHALMGDPGDPVGKPKAGTDKTKEATA